MRESIINLNDNFYKQDLIKKKFLMKSNDKTKNKNNKISSNREPNSVDRYVGARIKIKRKESGMTQGAVADKLNVAFQQFQKYEAGLNRIACSRLYEISKILNVPVSYFFEGYKPKNNIDNKHNFANKNISNNLNNIDFYISGNIKYDHKLKRDLKQ